MTRRSFLTTAGATLAASTLTHAVEGIPLEHAPLPYAPEALEPHIDALTMTIHHGKHHATYVTKLKEALTAGSLAGDDTIALIKDIASLPEAAQTAVRNNGGGHVNHTLFWKWMAPASSSPRTPDGKLAAAIQTDLGGLAEFQKGFAEAATKRFGSGWAWLIVRPDGKLKITSTPNQDNPLMKGIVADEDLGTPILGLDVWEHAYYLKYQNKRPDYITAWWNVVNWNEVARLHAQAAK
ncbi:MAG: superoxide dismutase [Verrucomicrobiaceae bacterium]|nr:superoxide dismutase [Verrucomicrobiaceae bacterium]